MKPETFKTQNMLFNSSFYCGNDVVQIARDLLGKLVFTKINGQLTSGVITETEAYAGTIDRASHAFGNRRTNRTEVLFGNGGYVYVYLCYGIHYLLNVVTNIQDIPHAVLIRAIHPIEGIKVMEARRMKKISKPGFSDGPGKLSQALGIDLNLNGLPLDGKKIGINNVGINIPFEEIISGPRIGVDYAGEDAVLPYRFRVIGEAWTQKNLLTP